MTTPIAYLTSIPRDPFKSVDERGHGPWRSGVYIYGALPLDKPSRWIVGSDGPDRRLNMDPLDFVFYPGYSEDFPLVLYDPTNGTISKGDIVRASDFQPGS